MSFHKLMQSAGSGSLPCLKNLPACFYPAHATRALRCADKAVDAKVIQGMVCPSSAPKSAVKLTGWPGSNPKTEALFVWGDAKGVSFATPHNGKAFRMSGKDFAGFIGSEVRSALGLTAPKAEKPDAKAKGKKDTGKPGKPGKSAAKPVAKPGTKTVKRVKK